ncbi:hypothetical protein GCM10010343_23940 [Streptomyces avidinii]|uniref:Transposase n=1 Tax=Streptomyces avidinii TaxID=1895 RepID=A0ABS4L3C4_STRAV|nr:hypothetical protein [Streptomyces avidinii]GGY97731.1 hypothetical protein GCM10010343_23940 [Streptomyces avidinii]
MLEKRRGRAGRGRDPRARRPARARPAFREVPPHTAPFGQGTRPWERILASVLAVADAADDIDWTVSVDSTVVRAHQHAAGALKKGRQDARSRSITHSDVPAEA